MNRRKDRKKTTHAGRPALRGFDLAMAVFHAALLVFGLILAGHRANEIRLALATSDWVPTPARVVGASLRETMSPRSTNPAYRLRVVHEYEVGGTTRRGDRFGFATPATADRAWLESRITNEFSPGRPVTVFVNPADARESVVERAAVWPSAVFAAVGLTLAGTAASGLWIIFRGSVRARESGKV